MRTPFQRDRDRIVHSKPFRRLKGKTQVFIDPQGDHYRTRMTHTLETTAISRVVARALRLNEDLTEAIGLGHDMGHTPFGHAGEDALDAGARATTSALRVPPPRAVAPDRAQAEPDPRGLRRDPHAHRRRVEPETLEGKIVPHRRPRRVHQPRHRRRRPLRAAHRGRSPARGDRAARPDRAPTASTGSSTTSSRPRRPPATSARARRSAAAMHRPARLHVRARLPRRRRPTRSTAARTRRSTGSSTTSSPAATRPTRSSTTSPG